MQDRPSAPELLDAMAAQLFGEVRDWVPRERRFQILVLANLCAVIARELRLGAEPDRADRELFEGLLGDQAGRAADSREAAAELSRRIRAGELDAALPETIEALRAHVERKLEVNRPGYDDGS